MDQELESRALDISFVQEAFVHERLEPFGLREPRLLGCSDTCIPGQIDGQHSGHWYSGRLFCYADNAGKSEWKFWAFFMSHPMFPIDSPQNDPSPQIVQYLKLIFEGRVFKRDGSIAGNFTYLKGAHFDAEVVAITHRTKESMGYKNGRLKEIFQYCWRYFDSHFLFYDEVVERYKKSAK